MTKPIGRPKKPTASTLRVQLGVRLQLKDVVRLKRFVDPDVAPEAATARYAMQMGMELMEKMADMAFSHIKSKKRRCQLWSRANLADLGRTPDL